MISVSSALRIVKRETKPLKSERIDIVDSIGRVLAEDVIADGDLPPFDRSQMDGYAVRSADTKSVPVNLKVVGEAAAGKGWHRSLKPGESVRIMTGAPLPAGADAVQKVELTKEADLNVTINEFAPKEQYVVRRGKEIKAGTSVIHAGEFLTDVNIAVAAAFGYSKIKVARRPKAAILSTGSEIVEIGRKPGRDQIRNSNSIMLDALCRKVGAEATVMPLISDDIAALRTAIAGAAHTADILVTTGGVSVGKYDLTKAALQDLGAELFFDRLRLKPGKPTVFARLGKTLIFSLPGNPVSAAVTFHLFVRSAILGLQGLSSVDLPHATAIAATRIKAPRERDSYVPVSLSTDIQARLIATPLKWSGSSDLVGFARSQALLFARRNEVIEPGSTAKIFYI